VLVVFATLGIYYLIEIFLLRKQAKEKHRDVQWNLHQLERALDLISKNEDDEISIGLDILFALNHPARLKALPRLAELASSQNPRIARRARKVIEIIGNTPNTAPQGTGRVALG
jgi:hypothetical protein